MTLMAISHHKETATHITSRMIYHILPPWTSFKPVAIFQTHLPWMLQSKQASREAFVIIANMQHHISGQVTWYGESDKIIHKAKMKSFNTSFQVLVRMTLYIFVENVSIFLSRSFCVDTCVLGLYLIAIVTLHWNLLRIMYLVGNTYTLKMWKGKKKDDWVNW